MCNEKEIDRDKSEQFSNCDPELKQDQFLCGCGRIIDDDDAKECDRCTGTFCPYCLHKGYCQPCLDDVTQVEEKFADELADYIKDTATIALIMQNMIVKLGHETTFFNAMKLLGELQGKLTVSEALLRQVPNI